jgi:hypothetical protein
VIYLSEILIQNPQLDSFDELCQAVREVAERSNAFHLKIDIKPNYGDTPGDWEDKIEAAFSGVSSIFGARKFTTEED